jgi:CTD kinase subunit alpha
LSPTRQIPSRSPTRDRPLSRSQNQNPPPQYPNRPHPRHRSRSPLATSRPRSRSRQQSPASKSSRPPTASDTASRRRPTPEFGSYDGPHPPPRSPRDQRGPKSAKKGRNRDHPGSSTKFDPSSGPNSIEVNMGPRGGYRGGYNAPPMQPAFQGSHDARVYSQSSGHATPNSSYHGSPPSQSPYGGSGRGWGNQQPYSPQQ